MAEKKKISVKEVSPEESYSDIKDIMLKAHAASGLDFKNDSMEKEDFLSRLKDGGAVFCAFDGDKAVGTMTVDAEKSGKWYSGEKLYALRYIAVLPEYAGNGIASRLCTACEEWADNYGSDVLFWTTSSKNKAAMATAEKNGFVKVDFIKFKGYDVPSVRMAKWKKNAGLKRVKAKIYFTYKSGKEKSNG